MLSSCLIIRAVTIMLLPYDFHLASSERLRASANFRGERVPVFAISEI